MISSHHCLKSTCRRSWSLSKLRCEHHDSVAYSGHKVHESWHCFGDQVDLCSRMMPIWVPFKLQMGHVIIGCNLSGLDWKWGDLEDYNQWSGNLGEFWFLNFFRNRNFLKKLWSRCKIRKNQIKPILVRFGKVYEMYRCVWKL